jgi:hypothetical protein
MKNTFTLIALSMIIMASGSSLGASTECPKFEQQFCPSARPKVLSGNYKESCEQCTVEGSILSCQCRFATSDGSRRTTLDLRDCHGFQVINDDANLACIPEGSYETTCRGCRVEGDILKCHRCSTQRYGDVEATFDLRLCEYGTIGNQNGRLICEGP